MFSGAFKDVITNIFAFLMGIFAIVQAIQVVVMQWFSQIGDRKPTLSDYIMLVISIITTVVAWYTGKNSNGKAKKPV